MTQKKFIKKAHVATYRSSGEYGFESGIYAFEDPLEVSRKKKAAGERNRISSRNNARKKKKL
jgi:hypothetical protein